MDKFLQTKSQIRDLYNKKIVSNVSFAVIDNNTVFTEYRGDLSWESSKKVSSKNLYDVASLTKVIGTTMLLLKLIRNKKINLYDSINKYLPEFSDSRVKIYHLLTHTSGIRGFIKNRNSLNPSDLKKELLKLPVTDEFNKIIRYTDTGMIFLGFIIEKIYNKPVQEVIMQEVINPLDFENMTFNPQKSLCIPTENNLQGIVHDPKAQILGVHCGSAGLFSNLNDLVKFSQYILKNNDQTIDSLFKNWTSFDPGRSLGWDLRLDPIDNHCVIYHTGFTGTFITIDKVKQTAIIVLTNRVNPSKDNKLFLIHRDYSVNT
ncbi:serine hydrolase domain-containing protein [Companilactobacillus sp. DQM5]|uniref:serine hydrolase domain-containing protein n=1 Tax=Companilactobacillus sp. DQM5 TaxID=3463359 RepID=UPI004059ABDE